MQNHNFCSDDKFGLVRSFLLFKETKELWYKIEHFPSYALIKGEALSLMSYKGVGKRVYNDIDILVDRTNIRELEKICIELGFVSRPQSRVERIVSLSASHQIYPYHNYRGNYEVNIDLNFDIFWGEYSGKRISISDFLSDTIEISIFGIPVKTLSPIKTMVQLILHHYKEMNSIYHLAGHNCINYNMFRDVYFLWKNNKDIVTLEGLYDVSWKYEIIPYVFYVLYFTNVIFKDIELHRYVETFRTSEGESLLEYYGLTEKERKLWKVDFKTRLETKNLYELIRDDLTKDDFEKLERNRKMFG